jgi:hypothetical protein
MSRILPPSPFVVRQDKERNDSGGLEDLLLRFLAAEMGFDAKKKVRKNKTTGLNHHLTSENVRKTEKTSGCYHKTSDNYPTASPYSHS